jgi:TPR repeat protein
VALIREAAARGDRNAEAVYGWELLRGRLVDRDPFEALRLLERAAAKGNGWAAYLIGGQYIDSPVLTRDDAKAWQWYRRAAELGDDEAQNNLGWCLLRGQGGLSRDVAAGMTWIIKAAEQGQPNAQTTLGYHYEKGNGVPRDYALARFWNEQAAAQNFAIAMLNLGELAEKGLGQPVDVVTAQYWYRRAAYYGEYRGGLRLAASQGERWAQARLGLELLDPPDETDDPDPEEALTWLRKAAAQGEPSALRRLTQLGEPVPAASVPTQTPPRRPSGRRRINAAMD